MVQSSSSDNVTSSSNQFDLLIGGGRCVLPHPTNPDFLITSTTSIAIKDGRIAAVGDQLSRDQAREYFDASGLHVLPGVIDSQVHFREPGLTHKEDLESGTRGAVLGGVTAVFEMPNTKPSTTSRELLEQKLAAAQGRAWCDHAFFIGATKENAAELGELEALPGCCGVKIFMGSSTGSLLVANDDDLFKVLLNGFRRVAIHAEDEDRLIERKKLLQGSPSPAMHPVWRDEVSALNATTRIIRIARQAKRPVHILHVTTAQEMDLLKTARDITTVEVTPQHLTLAAPECYERLGTLAQMNPPIREAVHRTALWRALQDGIVTVIGSDHAPHTLEEKAQPYPSSPSGMTGVQTLLPLMLDHVNQGRLSLERLVELVSRNPARIYKARGKGAIRPGFDADLTLVDLQANQTISNAWIASKVGWTPFDGMQVQGWPMATLIRGQIVMREGQLLGKPSGQPVGFEY